MMMTECVEGGRAEVGEGMERLVKLHQRLKRIAKARALLDAQEAEALRDAQRLQLWKQFGYTSLVDYMQNELGYTPRAAEDRLRVANALPQLPKLAEALQSGELNFSQARELARVATPETEEKWIEKTQEMNVRQVEQAVAGHSKGDLPDDPIDPRLIRKTMYLSVRPETEVLYREAKKRLEKERGERLDDDAVMEALCRTQAAAARSGVAASSSAASAVGSPLSAASDHPGAELGAGADAVGAEVGEEPAKRRASGDGVAPYRISITLCPECKRGSQHGAGLVSPMSPPAIERAQCDAQLIGDVVNGVERASQTIPPAVRRAVLHRDRDRCQVPGCCSYLHLDIHHIEHREHGGTNAMSNLVTLCEAHHLAHHDGTLRIERVNGEIRVHRVGRNRFTRATREVATREALRARGFDRGRVRQIMTQTVTHVGETDLSEAQWLAIALEYARTGSS